jgi:hypothetical protein
MLYRLAADLVLIVHLAFVAFVVFGALFVMRWPRLMALHVPAVVWGILVEFMGILCPLTPLEVRLRELGGGASYQGDFIGHYIVAVLYPAGLTRRLQIGLGLGALLLNAAAYTYILVRKRSLASRARSCPR